MKITFVSHFNEKNEIAIEDICSQNVSSKESHRKLLSKLLPKTSDMFLCILWVFTSSNCLHSFKSMLLMTPLKTVSMWLKFKTKFENQIQIIFISDTFLLFIFLSVLIALELIMTLALKMKSSFSPLKDTEYQIRHSVMLPAQPPFHHMHIMLSFSPFLWKFCSLMISSGARWFHQPSV